MARFPARDPSKPLWYGKSQLSPGRNSSSEGFCCLCNVLITADDYDAQKVIAAGPGRDGSFVVACAKHFFIDGKETICYHDFLKDFAKAVARNMGIAP
jgi:hypothetical protein